MNQCSSRAERGQRAQQGKADDVGLCFDGPDPFQETGHGKAEAGDRDREQPVHARNAEMAGQVVEVFGNELHVILRTPR